MAGHKDIDEISGVETTGHEWDGIKELNTPLPRWWLWTFYVTIIWAVGYWFVMPAWPLVSSYTKGFLNHSNRANVVADMAAAREAQGQFVEQIKQASLEEITQSAELMDFALAGGGSAFAVNCSQCHGLGAQGFKGYPNLNDDDWLWGGSLEAIETTIRYGIRSGHDQARSGDMPGFVRDEILSRDQVAILVDYVNGLSAGSGGADPAAAELFAENCASCHGEGGEGNHELGAPRLADGIWLYGSDEAVIAETIANGRAGVMPNWEGRLDEATIKQLAVYVHSLGGGE